eukprot:GHVU01065145.1.p2 GENE.GHVU01065145.1~~GHVU01065145.1.p2  ORF type:complete len:109 (+),score=5.18 GHVU01065145.1:298-624(+)
MRRRRDQYLQAGLSFAHYAWASSFVRPKTQNLPAPVCGRKTPHTQPPTKGAAAKLKSLFLRIILSTRVAPLWHRHAAAFCHVTTQVQLPQLRKVTRQLVQKPVQVPDY